MGTLRQFEPAMADPRAEFERAAALTRNDREKDLLLKRAKACEAEGPKALSP